MIPWFLALCLAADPVEPVPTVPTVEPDAPGLVPVRLAGPDRSAPPAVTPAVPLDLPDVQAYTLRPGVRVHLLRLPGLTKARVDLMFRRGPLEIDGRNTAAFTAMAWTWDQATKGRSADDLAIYEAVHDVDVWTDSGLQLSRARMEAPVDDLDAGLELLRDVIVHPRFRRKDVKLLRENMLRYLLSEGPSRSDVLVSSALAYTWYPEDHPFGERPDAVGWRDLRVRELARRHDTLVDIAPVDVLVVGDLTWEQVEPRLVELLDGVGVDAPLPEKPAFTPPREGRIVGIDLRGTPQAVVAWRVAAPPLGTDDAPVFRLIDHAVGGSFLSRLNAELREERGLTYGIGSTYSLSESRGHWTIETEVDGASVGEVLVALEEILARVAADGLTAQEIEDGQADQISAWNDTLGTVTSAANVYGAWMREGRDRAWVRERLDAILAADVEDTTRVAARWLDPDAPRVVVVIGDRSKLEPQLEALGLQADWVPGELVVLGAM